MASGGAYRGTRKVVLLRWARLGGSNGCGDGAGGCSGTMYGFLGSVVGGGGLTTTSIG